MGKDYIVYAAEAIVFLRELVKYAKKEKMDKYDRRHVRNYIVPQAEKLIKKWDEESEGT